MTDDELAAVIAAIAAATQQSPEQTAAAQMPAWKRAARVEAVGADV